MYEPFNLKGRVALVTGGNGGIGLGMATALAQAGSDIMIWGTNAEKNQAATAELQATGVNVHALKVDVSDEAAVDDAVNQTVDKMGRIDTVIANAGVGAAAPSFTDMTTEQYRKVLSVNLDGVFFTLRAALKPMVTRAENGDPNGSLIIISSLSAISGAARNEHYAATKGAVISMMKGLSVEFARYGIRANAILPGWIATDMTAAAQSWDKFNKNVISRVPIRGWGKPEDFGGLAVYLASDASRFHTGDTLIVDGGYAVF